MKALVVALSLMTAIPAFASSVLFKSNSWLASDMRPVVEKAIADNCPESVGNSIVETYTSEPSGYDFETGLTKFPSYSTVSLIVQGWDSDGYHPQNYSISISLRDLGNGTADNISAICR